MKKVLNLKVELLALLVIFLIYFAFRLPNLTLQPIFADEAIYIRWSQIMKAEPTMRFISLQDGKTPLFMWVMMPLFKFFEDPLFAGRILSVISGFFTMLGLLFLGWKFFSSKIGLWAAFLYSITPFMVFFDRMALVDSMLAAFSIWTLNLLLLLVKYPRFDLAMFLGYLIGGALITKTPAILNVVAIPASLFAFERFKSKDRQSRVLKLFGLLVIALVIGFGIYNSLRLGPNFSNLSSRNEDYVRNPMELLARPWDPLVPHFNDLKGWSVTLFGVPWLTMFGIGLGRLLGEKIKEKRVLLAVILFGFIPLFIQMNLLRTFTARYLMFSFVPFFILASFGAVGVVKFVQKSRLGNAALVLVGLFLLSYPLYFNSKLLIDPSSATLPKNERNGYFTEWTAGYGFSEIAQFLIDKSKDGMVVVGTEGYFGTLPDGLNIYLNKHSHTVPESNRVVVIGGTASVSAQIRNTALTKSTYFVGNKNRLVRVSRSNLKLIKEYPKAIGTNEPQDAILFFEVLPEKSATFSGVFR